MTIAPIASQRFDLQLQPANSLELDDLFGPLPPSPQNIIDGKYPHLRARQIGSWQNSSRLSSRQVALLDAPRISVFLLQQYQYPEPEQTIAAQRGDRELRLGCCTSKPIKELISKFLGDAVH